MITAWIIAYSLAACNIVFILIDLVRYHAAEGTHLRYMCATIQWALVPPALAFPALVLLGGRHVLGTCGFLAALYVLYDLYTSDDDNWFRRKRKALKRRLTTMRLRTNLAGVRQ